MLRLGAIFIVLCMALIASSFGAVLYLLAGLNGLQSAIGALVALVALAAYNAVASRSRDRADLGGQIADLSRGTADLARQVAEIGRRAATLEDQGDKFADSAAKRVRAATESVSAELGDLSALVTQLAETVALHGAKLADIANVTAGGARNDGSRPRVNAEEAASPDAPERDFARATDAPSAKPSRETEIAVVRDAIEANRVDLFLQPIVTLPQRKVRYYEAFTRLRTADGVVLQPPEFLDAAEAGGMMPRIDRLLLFRSVQVVRRLQIKNREIGLFCNIAASTLSDPEAFMEILQFMDANRALAPSLVLEFKQDTLRAMGPIEMESLAALRELGFRFCMDRVTDLRMEPRDLGERGIRYVKVRAPFLLSEAGARNSDIHAADLSDLLGRFGISLIAEQIEAEAQVPDLLEYDVRFGQGFLFSHPRPVRAEALHGVPGSTAAAHAAADNARGKPAAGRTAEIAL